MKGFVEMRFEAFIKEHVDGLDFKMTPDGWAYVAADTQLFYLTFKAGYHYAY